MLGREEGGSRLCSFGSSRDKLVILNWLSSLWWQLAFLWKMSSNIRTNIYIHTLEIIIYQFCCLQHLLEVDSRSKTWIPVVRFEHQTIHENFNRACKHLTFKKKKSNKTPESIEWVMGHLCFFHTTLDPCKDENIVNVFWQVDVFFSQIYGFFWIVPCKKNV